MGLLTSLLFAIAATDTITLVGTACPRCRISAKPLAVLGPVDGFELDYGAISFLQTRDGRFVVTGFSLPGTIAVFGPKGEWQRNIGRKGSGPGEYRQPARVSAWIGDSILVLDAALSRISVLGPDLRFARLLRLTSQFSRMLGLLGGNIALTAIPRPGPGITIVSSKGGMIGAFGPIVKPTDLDHQRELTRGPSGDLLTGRADRYDIEQFSATGVPRTLFRRAVEWFPPVDSRKLGDGMTTAGPPATFGILSSGDSAVWHLTAVARLPFKRPVTRGPDGREQVDLGLLLAGKDTRVGLLDLGKRQVVADGLVQGLLWPGDTSPLVARLKDDSDRGPSLEVLVLTLERP